MLRPRVGARHERQFQRRDLSRAASAGDHRQRQRQACPPRGRHPDCRSGRGSGRDFSGSPFGRNAPPPRNRAHPGGWRGPAHALDLEHHSLRHARGRRRRRICGYEMLKGLHGVTTHEHREWIPVLENDQDMSRLAGRPGGCPRSTRSGPCDPASSSWALYVGRDARRCGEARRDPGIPVRDGLSNEYLPVGGAEWRS